MPTTYEEIRKSALAAYPELTEAGAVSEYIHTHPDAYRRYVESTAPVQKSSGARDAAREHIEWLAKQEQDRDPSLTPAQAVSAAMASREGRRYYADYRDAHVRMLKAETATEQEPARLPITKSSDLFQQLSDIASVIRRDNPRLSKEQSLLKAAEASPDLARRYNNAKWAEIKAAGG
jgi:hypothetical protein